MRIDNASGYVKEDWTHKYLTFDSADENKELLKRYNDDWLEHTKDYTKIKFNSDDNLPLNKQLRFYQITINIRCVISEDNKLYPQVVLDGALFSL